MKQADEAIDRVLAGLRASEAPTGMEGRILQAVRARAAAAAGKDSGQAGRAGRREVAAWFRVPALRMPAMAISGTAMAALLVVAAVSMRHHAGPQRVTRLEPLARQIVDRPAVVSERTAAVAPTRVHRGAAESVARDDSVAAAREVDAAYVAPDYEALAVEEMNAPSKPTPPLPMTSQEKLFRKAVIGEDFDQLAMLNPEEREKANAKSDEEFEAFFGFQKSVGPSDQNAPAAASGAPETKPGAQDVRPDDKPSTVNAQTAEPVDVAK